MSGRINQASADAGSGDHSLRFRKILLQSGSLIDVSRIAKSIGVRVPVALTREVWERCVGDEAPTFDEITPSDVLTLTGVLRACKEAIAVIRMNDTCMCFFVPQLPGDRHNAEAPFSTLQVLLYREASGMPGIDITALPTTTA